MVFVDTNVLVYLRDTSDPEKQSRAAEWIAVLWETGTGRLSQQVLQEFYVTMTRKVRNPRDPADVRDDVTALYAWDPVVPDLATLERAWEVEDRFGFSWWDALIVASALEAGARYLLTEDLQDGQTIEGLKIVDPFRVEPDELLSARSSTSP